MGAFTKPSDHEGARDLHQVRVADLTPADLHQLAARVVAISAGNQPAQGAAVRDGPRQPDLFGNAPDAPRRRRRVMMHVVDAGEGPAGQILVDLECPRCGFRSGWVEVPTVSKGKRGLPCPPCNPLDGEAGRGRR